MPACPTDILCANSPIASITSTLHFCHIQSHHRRTALRRIRACLPQGECAPISVAAQVAVLMALNAGLFEAQPLARMEDAQQAVCAAARRLPADLAARLLGGKAMGEADRSAIVEAGRAALAAMTGTSGSLRRKIATAGDLHAVVRTP